MRKSEVKIGGEYLADIGRAWVRVVVLGSSVVPAHTSWTGERRRAETRFLVRRADTEKTHTVPAKSLRAA